MSVVTGGLGVVISGIAVAQKNPILGWVEVPLFVVAIFGIYHASRKDDVFEGELARHNSWKAKHAVLWLLLKLAGILAGLWGIGRAVARLFDGNPIELPCTASSLGNGVVNAVTPYLVGHSMGLVGASGSDSFIKANPFADLQTRDWVGSEMEPLVRCCQISG